MAPNEERVSYDDLSPYQKALYAKGHPREAQQQRYHSTKLMGTFKDRKNYVVLGRCCDVLRVCADPDVLFHVAGQNLKLYLKHGLKLTKIHRAVRFTQRPFLSEFIKKVTRLRSTAPTPFLVRLFKLFVSVCVCERAALSLSL